MILSLQEKTRRCPQFPDTPSDAKHTHTRTHTPKLFPCTKSWDTFLLAICPFPIAPGNLPMRYPTYRGTLHTISPLPDPETPLHPAPSSTSQDKSPRHCSLPESQDPSTCALLLLQECPPQSVLPHTIFSQIVPPHSHSRHSSSLAAPSPRWVISETANAHFLP